VTLSAAAAKSRLLTQAGGDKDAAAWAWEKAGLVGRTNVSEDEYDMAVHELRALAWSWAQPGDDDEISGGGEADDREAPDITSTQPADAGRVDVDTSPPPANDQGVTIKRVAAKASQVFKADYDGAPRGTKTKVVDRLRHALIYAETGGDHTSMNDLEPDELAAVWARLDDIEKGRLSYAADPADDAAGVTFTSQTGTETTVMWTDIEPEGEG
jgi:hypothetical protein